MVAPFTLFFPAQGKAPAADAAGSGSGSGRQSGRSGLPPIVVNLNSSSSELKLLRVLQTLVNLSGKDAGESEIDVDRIGISCLLPLLSRLQSIRCVER